MNIIETLGEKANRTINEKGGRAVDHRDYNKNWVGLWRKEKKAQSTVDPKKK